MFKEAGSKIEPTSCCASCFLKLRLPIGIFKNMVVGHTSESAGVVLAGFVFSTMPHMFLYPLSLIF